VFALDLGKILSKVGIQRGRKKGEKRNALVK